MAIFREEQKIKGSAMIASRRQTIGLFFVFFCVLALSLNVFAQQDQDPVAQGGDVPEGMEVIQVTGGYRLIVPQGAKTRRVGAQIIVEGDKEYYSRRFYELSQEITDLRTQVEELKRQVGELKKNTQETKAERH